LLSGLLGFPPPQTNSFPVDDVPVFLYQCYVCKTILIFIVPEESSKIAVVGKPSAKAARRFISVSNNLGWL
jgi:hypothetical protein